MNKAITRIIFISFLALFSCQSKPTAPPTPPAPVNLQTVSKKTVLYYDQYPSTTQPLSQVNLFPEVQGYITAILAKDGAHVKKGQVLYEIDKRLFQANYDQASANLKVAQGNTKQAQQDADRYEYLNSQNAVAKQLYDHAVIALQNAKNAEKAAEEAVKTARTNLAYSVITAPFDGTIGFSQVRLGNMVSVGQTILNTISTDDPMAVDFLVNEKQLPFFESLEKGNAEASDSLFTLLMPDNSLYPFTGKISVIDRAVNSQTGTIRVRLVFPNTGYILRAGMSCIVRVHNQESSPQMLIPSKAIVEQMGEYFVFIAKDTVLPKKDSTKNEKETDTVKGPKFVALQRKVLTGQTIGPNVIIKSGIYPGDKVVVDGVQLLHDGSRINPGKKPATDSTAKGQQDGNNNGKKD